MGREFRERSLLRMADTKGIFPEPRLPEVPHAILRLSTLSDSAEACVRSDCSCHLLEGEPYCPNGVKDSCKNEVTTEKKSAF